MRPFLVAVFFCTGCAVRGPATFRLSNNLLAPPASSNLRVRCAPESPFPLKRGKLVISRELLQQQPPGSITRFANTLASRGCIADPVATAERIAYSVPLPPNTAFQLLYPNDRTSGWVDLSKGMKVQVVSPILKDDNAPMFETESVTGLNVDIRTSSNVVGFETSWYLLNRGFELLSVERTIEGKTSSTNEPQKRHFTFPSDTQAWRVFYKADSTEFTQIIVGARTGAELPAQVTSCAGASCVAIPKRVAVNFLMPITINGTQTFVHWGTTVGDALRRQGESVLPHLKVSKVYQGKLVPVEFDPSDRTVLKLMLSGGESLSF